MPQGMDGDDRHGLLGMVSVVGADGVLEQMEERVRVTVIADSLWENQAPVVVAGQGAVPPLSHAAMAVGSG
jgi:hypothetical protein